MANDLNITDYPSKNISIVDLSIKTKENITQGTNLSELTQTLIKDTHINGFITLKDKVKVCHILKSAIQGKEEYYSKKFFGSIALAWSRTFGSIHKAKKIESKYKKDLIIGSGELQTSINDDIANGRQSLKNANSIIYNADGISNILKQKKSRIITSISFFEKALEIYDLTKSKDDISSNKTRLTSNLKKAKKKLDECNAIQSLLDGEEQFRNVGNPNDVTYQRDRLEGSQIKLTQGLTYFKVIGSEIKDVDQIEFEDIDSTDERTQIIEIIKKAKEVLDSVISNRTSL